jgi:hypothetical protein
MDPERSASNLSKRPRQAERKPHRPLYTGVYCQLLVFSKTRRGVSLTRTRQSLSCQSDRCRTSCRNSL